MPGRVDYAEIAARYDSTRGVSRSALKPLNAALAGAPGPRLADVGGGTGNYAIALRDLGFEPVVVDRSEHMLARARAKGLETVAADAERLPFEDASFDAVTMISMIHQVTDWRTALAEARRVLRPGGRLAVKGFLRENLGAVHWIYDYFPRARRWMDDEHQSVEELVAELPGAELHPILFEDTDDASMAALCRFPELMLEDRYLTQNSFFVRERRDHPEGVEEGLARLRADLAGGRRPQDDPESLRLRERFGDALVVGWAKPAR